MSKIIKKMLKNSKLLGLFQIIKNCQNISKFVKIFKNCQLCKKLLKFSKIIKKIVSFLLLKLEFYFVKTVKKIEIVKSSQNCFKKIKIVKILVRSCFLITLIKCLKGHKSLGSLFVCQK